MPDHRLSRLAKGATSESRLSIGTKIPDFFTIAPVLTSILMICRRNRGDPSSLISITEKKHSRFGLALSRPRADRSLSRPTSVFCTTIGVSKILSRSVEIWQYEGQKPVFE